MTVMLDVVTVLASALKVEIAGVPIAAFGRRLRAPMCPDTELGVAEPFRAAVRFERFASALERSGCDGRRGFGAGEGFADVKGGQRTGHEFERGSPGYLHGFIVVDPDVDRRDGYVLVAKNFFASELHPGCRRNSIRCHAPQYLLAVAEWQIFVDTNSGVRFRFGFFFTDVPGKNDPWHFS